MALSVENACLKFLEFYYDVFNHAPEVLFRFYDHQSLFTHKTIDGTNEDSCLTVGQGLIRPIIQRSHFYHNSIKPHQINFLLSVDNLNILQVIGELTDINDGKFGFTQTFVLEICDRESWPYIRSDMFRIQDFIGNDEEIEISHLTDDNVFTLETDNCMEDVKCTGSCSKISKSKTPKKKMTGKMKEIAQREAKINKDILAAIRIGDYKLFNRLIPGADISLKDKNGRTILHEAVTRGNKKIVSYLLRVSFEQP